MKQAAAGKEEELSKKKSLRRLRFTWCKAGSGPAGAGGGSRSAPSEPEAAAAGEEQPWLVDPRGGGGRWWGRKELRHSAGGDW